MELFERVRHDSRIAEILIHCRTLLEDGQSLLGNKNGRFEGSWDAVLSCCASQPAIAAE